MIDILSPVVEPGGDAFVAQDLFEDVCFSLQPVFIVRFEVVDFAIALGELSHCPQQCVIIVHVSDAIILGQVVFE